MLARYLWLACVNDVKCWNVGWWTTPRHCQCQPANITEVDQLYANCRGLDQENGDVESLTFLNHYTTSSLDRVMGNWTHSSCLQGENFYVVLSCLTLCVWELGQRINHLSSVQGGNDHRHVRTHVFGH